MAHQLREDAVVLCCFCRLGRVTAELFGLWLQILRRAPRAVLWLYKHPRTAALRLQAHAERAGIAGARPLRMRACSVVASPPRPRGCPAGRGARRGSALNVYEGWRFKGHRKG